VVFPIRYLLWCSPLGIYCGVPHYVFIMVFPIRYTARKRRNKIEFRYTRVAGDKNLSLNDRVLYGIKTLSEVVT